MSVERRFLDWKNPALLQVTEFLLQNFSQNGVCNMQSVVVVTPGARAGRRLLEILTWQIEQHSPGDSPLVFIPPRIVTPGTLPELLLPDVRELPTATELETLLAWTAALRGGQVPNLNLVFPSPPSAEEFLAWWPLARELEALDRELATEGVEYSAIESHCRARGLECALRWNVLAAIAEQAREALRAAGKQCPVDARAAALKKPESKPDLTVVLVSVVDLNTTVCGLLEACGCRTIALVHAPETEDAGFGPYGQLHFSKDKTAPDYWNEKLIPLEDDQWSVVDLANDQAAEILLSLEGLEHSDDDSVTVGMGDETIAPGVERAIETTGRRARRAVAQNVAQSSPAQLLRLLAEYLGDKRPEQFSALVRHPQIGDWLARKLPATSTSRCWLDVCDSYFAERLPLRCEPAATSLPPELKTILQALDALLPPEYSDRRALGLWMQPLAELLEAFYEDREFSPGNPHDAPTLAALQALGKVLREVAACNESTPLSPQLNLREAIRFVLTLAGNSPLPEPGGEPAVELLGWLDVHLDDAPVLIVTSLNDGLIPESVHAAPFLTDSLRREFGLLDNRRRYARDAYLLSAMVASKEQLTLISARRSPENDPLLPSRLLFACDADTAMQRALRFYSEDDAPAALPPTAWPSGDDDKLAFIPRPAPLAEPIRELRVTAFRSYLACPYRFYLRHICGLDVSGAAAPEMESSVFGSLMHDVLRDYGRWLLDEHGGVAPDDLEMNLALLGEMLRGKSQQRFGSRRLPSVEIQLHQMQRRLEAFARAQIREARSGWKIAYIECDLESNDAVDGELFRIYGRADRIDFHPDSGAYRVLDYKTGDTKRKPEKTHLAGPVDDKHWIDLQLPLYRHLAGMLNIDVARVQVGYFSLPADLNLTGVEMAEWDDADFESAYRIAEDVIRALRQQTFWPPSEAPLYNDGLAAICLDSHMERNEIIAQTDAPEIFWPKPARSKAVRTA